MDRQTPADSRSMIRFIIVSETRYREGWYKGCSASLACNEIRRDPNSKFVLRLLDSSAPAAFRRFVEICVSQWTTNKISQWSLFHAQSDGVICRYSRVCPKFEPRWINLSRPTQKRKYSLILTSLIIYILRYLTIIIFNYVFSNSNIKEKCLKRVEYQD